MAFEALNNAGAMDVDLLVILNDNDMSISPSTSARSTIISRALLSGRLLCDAAQGGKKVLSAMPPVRDLARRCRRAREGHGDARHDVRGDRLQLHRPDRRPRSRCAGADAAATCASCGARSSCTCVTRKGQGYKLAEDDPDPLSRAGPSSIRRRHRRQASGGKPTYTQIFGEWLCDMAAQRSERSSASRRRCAKARVWCEFSAALPDRYFDVGIAEQHAVTFAAGLACEGCKPVRRDLLDVPAARLRPADSRRAHPEPAGRVRDRSRRPGRRATARRTTAASICRICAACRT